MKGFIRKDDTFMKLLCWYILNDEIRIIRLCSNLDSLSRWRGGVSMISFMLGAVATATALETFAEDAMLGVRVYLASRGVKKK